MAVAKISGVALRPGVSRNRRLYSAELIAKAAKRMQERLADPDGLPIVMRTHHDAGDNTAKIVGRVVEVSVDNDRALRYKAELSDTFHGQEIAGLVRPKGGKPSLRSVSIHGYWLGDTRQVQTEGGLADTADDLEIDAIDFTAFPGVVTALIDHPDGGGKATESGGVARTPISESSEADVVLIEDDTGWADISHTVPEGGVVMARGDVGETRYWVSEAKYSADDMKGLLSKGQAMKNASGEPSYPIADVSDLKKAIRAVGRGKSGHDAIRKHIIKRAKALGQVGLIPDNWNSDGSMKESGPLRLGEIREYYPNGPDGMSGFCIDAYSGPLSVTVRGCVPPDQLRAAAQMAACAAMDAINCMDPDDDADIDVMDDDGAMGEQGTAAVGGVIPDDSMTDLRGESVEDDDKVAEDHMTEDQMRALIAEAVAEATKKTAELTLAEMRKALGVKEMTMAPDGDGHSHTHEMDGEQHTHAHMHTHESDGDGMDGYTHGHTHSHVHASTDGPSHDHGHNHVHMTSSSATAESTETIEKESAMSDTQKAAEAAPTRTLTEADMAALGSVIGNSLAEALRAIAEQKDAKHAATTTQETTETAESVTAESTTQKAAIDVSALKESLANELRKELRDEFRNELLKENGLPQRRGYRVSENSEEEVQLSDADIYNKHRVDILLGQYASLATPADSSAA